MRWNRIAKAISGVAVLVACAPAFAGTASSSLGTSATVSAACAVGTTAVAFGTVSTLSATPGDATGTITVTCTNGTTWTATAGAGAGTGATLLVRKMSSGANTLNYVLYKDSARTSIWGDGIAPTASITGTGTGAAQANTIYGRVPGSQGTVPIGSYADTVAVTVSF